MQKERRKFIKFALSLPICIPIASLLAYSGTKCKDEVEYGDWKTYETSITYRRSVDDNNKHNRRAGHIAFRGGHEDIRPDKSGMDLRRAVLQIAVL
jgi:hypothetical protein